ncbi:MAG TPA: cell envelope biogenesis protein OmpA, partial [Myxococcota bacterium]
MNSTARWSAVAFIAAVLASTSAFAEPDTFFLGNGHSGALVVNAAGTQINVATGISAALTAGTSTVPVLSSTSFVAGDLVLVLQHGLIEGEATDNAGRFEYARVQSTTATSVTLTAPLVGAFGTTSQLVRVPEYTTVTVNLGASITAPPFNGVAGGVVAFFATGAVDNAGAITAAGRGFRGGIAAARTCAQSAASGEGLVLSRFPTTTASIAINGGGGGACTTVPIVGASGLGGGGGGGAGGGGVGLGLNAVLGGPGGTGVTRNSTRLLFGGGGGAGHSLGAGVSGG